jgi:hypothetical protein
LVIWLFGYLVIWLFGYLVIWLFGYLVVWLFGCLVVWFVGSLFDLHAYTKADTQLQNRNQQIFMSNILYFGSKKIFSLKKLQWVQIFFPPFFNYLAKCGNLKKRPQIV